VGDRNPKGGGLSIKIPNIPIDRYTIYREASSATISACGQYRYTLMRNLERGNSKICMFIMLNPSTADAKEDDPTIRRCINYAKDWGYGKLLVANLFAFRATDPKVMKSTYSPIGPQNDNCIIHAAQIADASGGVVICAWGTHGTFKDRAKEVINMLVEIGIDPKCLKMTQDGHPGHPLYLAKSLKPKDFK